ncbi:serine hydrolase [Tenacibaculum sp. M341]|uniref:serine hydrolase n=1 Tax=Tenacibaculum sp. M341 TaxID=2530339 RepID=UPI00104F7918|nr:serine hydrolase [Tenacibaculum sp. M341]TCI89985.1 serine hydrolase [Tenacibaculum sp. M341]
MKNSTYTFLLLTINFLLLVSCSKKETASNTKSEPTIKKVDAYLNAIIKADEIPGMAVAIVQNGQVVHQKNYGLANIAHKVPVTDSTLFRAYSTTKLMTSVAVFQLIEEGKISLNTQISKYISELPESWKNITIAHLLSCSSGLPDYKNLDQNLSDKDLLNTLTKQDLHFEKGYKYEYSQTNYWFLQMIIEKVTNQKFEEFVIENQFNNTSDEVLFASNSLVDYPNRVAKYQYNKVYNTYEKTTYAAGNRSLAGNGLNATLNSLIVWNNKLDKDQLIKSETKLKMMSPFAYKNNRSRFAYTWGVYGPADKQYYGFTGGGVSALMKFVNHDLSIIILTNGFKNRPVIANMITYLSGIMDDRLMRQDRVLNEDIRLAFLTNSYENGAETFHQIKQKHQDINFERGLNITGYCCLLNKQLKKSIAIFKLYTQEYPNSSNAFDSLGEAYFTNQQYDLAKSAYEKALELESSNKNAMEMILKIENIVSKTVN